MPKQRLEDRVEIMYAPGHLWFMPLIDDGLGSLGCACNPSKQRYMHYITNITINLSFIITENRVNRLTIVENRELIVDGSLNSLQPTATYQQQEGLTTW